MLTRLREPLDLTQTLIGICLKLLLALGTLLVMVYCAAEGVLPDGFSVADAFVVVGIVLSFGFITVVGTAYGAISTFWLLMLVVRGGNALLRKFGKEGATATYAYGLDPGWMHFVGSATAFIVFGIVAIGVRSPIDTRLSGTIAFFMEYGFLLLCVVAATPRTGKRLGWKLSAALLFSAVFLAANTTHPSLLNMSTGMLGIRSLPGDAVVVSDDAKKAIEQVAAAYGLSLRTCALTESKQWILKDARAVWHGVGATSYLRVFNTETETSASLLLPVERKSVVVYRRDGKNLVCRSSDALLR